MKDYKTKIFKIIIFMSIPFNSLAQEKDCGTDYACFYEQKNRLIEQDRQRQEQELEAYRNQQLQLQQEQLEQMQMQNELLEEQLQEINDRQTPSKKNSRMC
ncbi:MAG: hypothetical protein NDI69_05035 [Bacteriovoracaceae bacterium]|nr:hypothetical protein [Bacteriovoracaceae bacterium]